MAQAGDGTHDDIDAYTEALLVYANDPTDANHDEVIAAGVSLTPSEVETATTNFKNRLFIDSVQAQMSDPTASVALADEVEPPAGDGS
jgi:hypothetical protein